jgi:hypothetical protein
VSRPARTGAIDPDDLEFMSTTGVSLSELARRVGIKPHSLYRQVQRYGIRMPAAWTSEMEHLRRHRETTESTPSCTVVARSCSTRRTRSDLPRVTRGTAVKRPDDCCPYCPTQRAAQPSERLAWAMRPVHVAHCGRNECVRAHERWRYQKRKAAA